jgi:hypothetical protein
MSHRELQHKYLFLFNYLYTVKAKIIWEVKFTACSVTPDWVPRMIPGGIGSQIYIALMNELE